MALLEKGISMGNSTIDSSERLSIFHRDRKTRTLPNGKEIPVVKDINAFTSKILEEEIKAKQPQTITPRRPLARLRGTITGLVGGAIKG